MARARGAKAKRQVGTGLYVDLPDGAALGPEIVRLDVNGGAAIEDVSSEAQAYADAHEVVVEVVFNGRTLRTRPNCPASTIEVDYRLVIVDDCPEELHGRA